MKIVVIDAKTLGVDIDLTPLSDIGELTVYDTCTRENLPERIRDCDVIVTNKLKLNEEVLKDSPAKIICLAATGYDPIDTEYCKRAGIGVANVKGYSTDSVAQITVSMALNLLNHLPEYTEYTSSGEYTESGIANHVSPCFHEAAGLTWGIIGAGNIGMKVYKTAEVLGCRPLAYKRTPSAGINTANIDEIIKNSDIISVHLPLTDDTRNLINKERIGNMKKNAIFINVARGAVTDEDALAEAIKEGKIAALGADVYSAEPFGKDHPFYEIKGLKNVCLTPHMAWAAYEARKRCIAEIVLNIEAFFRGEIRNRVEL